MSEPRHEPAPAHPGPFAAVPRALWIALAALALLVAGLTGALASRLLAPMPAAPAAGLAASPAPGGLGLSAAHAAQPFHDGAGLVHGAVAAPATAGTTWQMPAGALAGGALAAGAAAAAWPQTAPAPSTVAPSAPPQAAAQPAAPVQAALPATPAAVPPAAREPVRRAATPAPAPQRVAYRDDAAPRRRAAVCRSCGVVESVAAVRSEGPASGLGAVAGGVLGGVLGNQVGGGSGKKAMAVLGAVGGGFAGHEVEKRVRSRTVYDVRVRMDDGSRRTLRREDPPAVGTRLVLDSGAA